MADNHVNLVAGKCALRNSNDSVESLQTDRDRDSEIK